MRGRDATRQASVWNDKRRRRQQQQQFDLPMLLPADRMGPYAYRRVRCVNLRK